MNNVKVYDKELNVLANIAEITRFNGNYDDMVIYVECDKINEECLEEGNLIKNSLFNDTLYKIVNHEVRYENCKRRYEILIKNTYKRVYK